MNTTLANLELSLNLDTGAAAAPVTPQSAWSPPLRARKPLKLDVTAARQRELPLEPASKRLCIGHAGGSCFDALSELQGDRKRESLRERSFTLNPRFDRLS